MAKSTKSTYKPAKKGNYKSVVRMAGGGNVSELNYSERREYIEENYAPFITDAQMIFSIWDSGIEYDYKADRKEVVSSIIESYQALGDYTESTLPQETIYEIQDWDLVRREIDPETDEVIGETPLEELSADNTYNFSYNGLVDLNWRVYHDVDYDRFFYVIMPHLGGDIRGNYGDAIILEGNDKDELFYRFYEGFISGGASIYIKFKDGSEIGFDSEQDSDSFSFRLNEVFEPTGMALKYLEDYEKLDSYTGDEFLEETIDIYLARKGVAPKMMAGGSLNDETPMAYIQILGYDEGKWFNLTDYADGQDVIDGIYDWMNGLNQQFGGNREEYEVTDYEGFGDDLYDEYMGANEFEEIIEAYEKYESSDFPADVISAYKKDSGSRNDSLSDVIDEMENNYFGKYDNLTDFGYEMVQQGVYEPSDNDVYITDTDKRIIAGEESDSLVNDMSFEDLMNIAPDTQSEYDDEKSELEDKIVEIQEEINDLTSLLNDTEDDDEYERISDEIESKEIDLEDAENSYVDIDSRFEDKAREEARDSIYDEIYDKLENDLSSWLEEYGYTSELQNLSFLSVDYENIGDYLSSDYLIVEYDGEMYFFNNYAKGGRITASKRKPKFDYYIVESSTKKLVSGYSTKAEATEQRKLLVKEYPSMRFEIYTLGNLEAKTDLDVYAKKDYVELSTLDKIKKVSVDAYRYGQEKVGQANAFLEKHDVKGKIKRGARKVWEKTKQGGNWLKRQWQEADFGDGKGKAKFFADGGEFVDGAKYKVILKSDKHYGQVGFAHYGIEEDNRGVLFVSLEFPNGVNTYSMDEVERVYANGGMAGLGEVSGMLPNPLPMSTITPMANGGSVQSEIDNLDNRIRNLEELVVVINDEEKPEMYATINNLKKERESLLKNGNKPEEVSSKKSFFGLFAKGGKIAKDEYDVYDNKRMLKNQANEVQHHSEELNNAIQDTKKVPAWVIAKMERATTDLSDITHYLDGENKMAYGGSVGGERYDIVPYGNKFVVVRLSKETGSKKGVIIRDFQGEALKFDDINSAKNFINNIEPKYPYGIPKANAGMILLASQLLQQQQQKQQQQQQQPQVVYYVPQPQPQETQNTGIVQNIPEMASGGDVGYDNELINDFCITNLIELANELQSVKYYVTHRFKETDFESKKYKGRLVIVYKEPVSTNSLENITYFLERTEDCHHIFEQSVNVSGSEPNSISINLLSDKFADLEFGKGGKVYDYAPKKINLAKTKKIKTHLGTYVLGLITNDFVYFVNSEEGDDNANTMMYNKNGELLSDNIHATNDLFETLETQSEFEFIHPDMEAYRQEILKGN